MIFDQIKEIEDVLRIDSTADYPHIDSLLKPAVDRAIREAVGDDWITDHETDGTVQQCACALLAAWFASPEMAGRITPGANFLLTQLQARALEGD